MIALGVLTHDRPEYCDQVLAGVAKHLAGVVDRVYVRNDGSDPRHLPSYHRAYRRVPSATVAHDPRNRGVAAAKNALLWAMLDDGADWLFLLEDDVVPVSSEAITGYLAACEASGFEHLSFAHHGPANTNGSMSVDGPVTCWPNYVGAFSAYSAESLRTVGMFDEGFRNCCEHVHLTLRMARAGYTDPRPYHAADATGSERWLAEIPGSFERSTIRNYPTFDTMVGEGLAYWREADPVTYHMLYPLERGKA